jgi:hypothetical protein
VPLEQQLEVQGDQELVLDDQHPLAARPSFPSEPARHSVFLTSSALAERERDLGLQTRRREGQFRPPAQLVRHRQLDVGPVTAKLCVLAM